MPARHIIWMCVAKTTKASEDWMWEVTPRRWLVVTFSPIFEPIAFWTLRLEVCGHAEFEQLLWGRKDYQWYLLSDHVGIMASLYFEGAVVGPQIDWGCDASDTSFVDLRSVSDINSQWWSSWVLTISAASVPAIENSKSAYFFQYPKKRGNFARKRSYTARAKAMVWGLEFRLSPPSKDSAACTSLSHAPKLSSFSCYENISKRVKS